MRTAAILIGLGALVAAPLVLAQVQDRIGVRGLEGNDTDHYARSLSIVAVSPPEYKRGCCYDSDGGEWSGPRYEATARASLGGEAKIDWDIGVAVRKPSTRATLVPLLTHGWPIVAQGTHQVEHRVGGRKVGTIPGYWILTRSTFYGDVDAAMEAMIGFPLCDGNTVYAKFGLLLPSGDSAGGAQGYGDYVIAGQKPTVWNAAKAMQAIRGIRLEGNRPSARVTAAARGRAIVGQVQDCSKHALAGQSLALQRKVGGAWSSAGTGRTSATGSFSIAARGAGTYRVVAGARSSNAVSVR